MKICMNIIKCLALSMLALSSLSGNAVIDPDWALFGVNCGTFSEGLAEFHDSKGTRLYGFVNTNGKVAIAPKFKQVGEFHRGTTVVTDENDRKGIIDTKGEYTLQPGNYEIRMFEKLPGYYKVTDKETDKSALSDGYKFLTGFDFDFIDFYNAYPFLQFSSKDNGPKGVMNVLDFSYYPDANVIRYGNRFTAVYDNKKEWLFSLDGELIDPDKYKISSKGTEVFEDPSTGKLGIRDSKTKAVITPARYFTDHDYQRSWIKDIVVLYDSISPEDKSLAVVLNQDGKIILNAADFTPSRSVYVMKDLIETYPKGDYSNNAAYRCFDYNGKEITKINGNSWYPLTGGYYGTTGHLLYNAKDNTVEKDVMYPSDSDDVIKFMRGGKWYFKNAVTGKESGPFDLLEDFNEGVAVVTNGSTKFIIDKNGKEYHYPDDISIGVKFSDGVINAYDRTGGVRGCIYNPLGHEGFTYNQTENNINDYNYIWLIEKGKKLFDEKKYSQAADICYRLMMLKPENKDAFYKYTVCLAQMRRLDEALTAIDLALETWPDWEEAKTLRTKILADIQSEKEAEAARSNAENNQEYYGNANSTISFLDALGNFANALANAFGGTPTYTPQSYGENSFSGAISAGGGNYQSNYNNWERLAERHYNSLTNLGYSATSSSGKKHGSAGGRTSAGNYIQQKRALREAQAEMRKIRRQAAGDDVTIPKSRWEDASVGY